MRNFYFLALGLIFTACSQKSKPNPPLPPPVPLPAVEEPAPPPAPESDAVHPIARLRRTPCFGRCPAYEVQIYSDGKATYKGQRNVEMIGQYTGLVDQPWREELIKTATDFGFFGFSDFYPVNKRVIADLSNTEIAIENTQTHTLKSITINHDAPQALRDFVLEFDKRIEAIRWKKAEE